MLGEIPNNGVLYFKIRIEGLLFMQRRERDWEPHSSANLRCSRLNCRSLNDKKGSCGSRATLLQCVYNLKQTKNTRQYEQIA